MTRPQPDTPILGYGSLLNVESLKRTVPRLSRGDLAPVRVDGFARIFQLVSLSRSQAQAPVRAGLRGAVLDARPWRGAQMGAVCFDVRHGAERDALDRREFCYDRLQDVDWRGFYQPTHRGQGLVYTVSDAATLRERFPDFAPTSVLDQGCTVGHNTLPFKEAWPDADVTGIDIGASVESKDLVMELREA